MVASEARRPPFGQAGRPALRSASAGLRGRWLARVGDKTDDPVALVFHGKDR